METKIESCKVEYEPNDYIHMKYEETLRRLYGCETQNQK